MAARSKILWSWLLAVHQLCLSKSWYSVRTFTVLLSLGVFWFLSVPARAQNVEDVGGLLEELNFASTQWVTYLVSGTGGAAYKIFLACLALQFAWVGYRLLRVSQGHEAQFSVMALAMQRLPVIAGLLVVLLFWSSFGLMAADPFLKIGTGVTGINAFDPGGMMGQALGVIKELIENTSGGPQFFFSLVPILQLIMAVTIFAGFGAISIRAFLLTVEGNFVTSVGPIACSLGPWSVTAGMADNYFRYTAKFGLEYMGFMFFLSVGQNLPKVFGQTLADIGAWDSSEAFVAIGNMVLITLAWAIAAWVLPKKAAENLVHMWTPGIAEAMKK